MGIMVVCETELAEDSGLVIIHSSSVVRKKNPDRTLSVDYRIISDLRRINLGNSKGDCYTVEVAKLSDLAARILKLTRQFPTLPALMKNVILRVRFDESCFIRIWSKSSLRTSPVAHYREVPMCSLDISRCLSDGWPSQLIPNCIPTRFLRSIITTVLGKVCSVSEKDLVVSCMWTTAC